MKLLEAKQAKDFADTDIGYREKRLQSLYQSLKEEEIEENININPAITINKFRDSETKLSSHAITRNSVPSF